MTVFTGQERRPGVKQTCEPPLRLFKRPSLFFGLRSVNEGEA